MASWAQMSGSGTEEDPYQVRTADDLFDVRNDLNAHYLQVADIDLGAWLDEESPTVGWNPISNFAGVYDGGNHVIKGLYANRPTQNYVGLFGSGSNKTSSCIIRNLILDSPVISGKDYVGTLIGYTYYPIGYIDNIEVYNAVVSGTSYVGGVIGCASQSGNISKINVNNAVVKGKDYVGGIAGSLKSNQSKAFSVYENTGRYMEIEGNNSVGGMIGFLDCSDGSVYDNRLTGVQITASRNVGGMIGFGKTIKTINDCLVIKPNISIIDGIIEGGVTYQCNCVGGLIGQREQGCESVTNNVVLECNLVGGDHYTGGLIGEDYKTNNSKVIGNYVSGGIKAYGHAVSKAADVGGLVAGAYNGSGSWTMSDNRVDGTIISDGNKTSGIGNSGQRNVFTGVVKGVNWVSGIYQEYVASGSNNVCCADTISGKTDVYRIGLTGTNYAYNGTVVIRDGEVINVEDGGENGISYSKRLLMRKSTYLSMGYDFENNWAIVEGETLPYNINQSTPATIEVCASGAEARASGTASGNGTVYVFVDGNMIEGSVVNGKWDVALGNVKEGGIVKVSVETEGKKPSIVTSAKAEHIDSPVVELDENSTVAPSYETDVNVRVLRTINANEWSTICLPFAMTEAQAKAAFGDDVQIGDFNDYEVSADGKHINVKFNDVTAIEANHPYIIKVSDKVTEFTADGVDVDPQEAVVDFDTSRRKNQPRQMVGTYVANTVLDWGTLFLSGNQFWYSTGNTKMKAFRAYFNFYVLLPDFEDNYESRQINMLFGDNSTTGIGEIEDGRLKIENSVYDLQGRRVKSSSTNAGGVARAPQYSPLKKGLYVKEGKKIIIR